MDPALWLEGYGLLFSPNRRGGSPEDFTLFQTITREVTLETVGVDWPAFWTSLDKVKWWLLLSLAALLGLAWLILTLIDDGRREQLGLTQVCFLASAGVHLLIAFLLSLWVISQHVIQSDDPMLVNIDSDALAEERMALEIREKVDDLPNTEPPPATGPFESPALPPAPPPRPVDAVTQEFATEPIKAVRIPVEMDEPPTEKPLEKTNPAELPPASFEFDLAAAPPDTPTFVLESTAPRAAEEAPKFTAPDEKVAESTPGASHRPARGAPAPTRRIRHRRPLGQRRRRPCDQSRDRFLGRPERADRRPARTAPVPRRI